MTNATLEAITELIFVIKTVHTNSIFPKYYSAFRSEKTARCFLFECSIRNMSIQIILNAQEVSRYLEHPYKIFAMDVYAIKNCTAINYRGFMIA